MELHTLSEAQGRLLREQVFDATHPGRLLHDFQVVLDFIGTGGVKSSGKYNLLPMESLDELNRRLARPLRLQLKRPQVRSNPYLWGLNLLLRASGIGQVEGSGAKARLVLDPAMLLQWQHLNPTEQYFNLLEAWLLVGRPEMIGERGSFLFGGFLTPCLLAWRHIPPKGERFSTKRPEHLYIPGIGRDFFNLALMDLAGLLEVESSAGEAPSWSPGTVRHTPFGDALFTLLVENFFKLYETPSDEEEEDEEDADDEEEVDEEDAEMALFGHWQPIFQPYFPEWRENLEPPEVELREGMFIFRVSLGKVWRRFAVPSKCTLDELVSAILKSVRFDDDHLYEFTYRNRFGATETASHSYCEEGPYGAEVRVGELPLAEGQSMRLTYDFGDDWRFDVKLERVDPPDAKVKSPRLLESHGKAPEQYGY